MHRPLLLWTIPWLRLLVPVLAAQPEPPADLIKTRAAFAAAVAANDVGRAAALTRFPLKNTVFQAPPMLSRAAFPKLFADYRAMAACIKTAPLVLEAKGWTLECNGNILRFGLRGPLWRHTEYENINE